MDAESIKRARELYGPFKKFPFYFVDHPEVNTLLDILPEALDEVERLQEWHKRLDELIRAFDLREIKSDTERAKLRAENERQKRVIAALNGDASYDANGSPVD